MLLNSWVSLGLLGLAVAAPQEPTAAPSSKTLPPSPTGSGVCEPHGDHWHCHAASTASPASHGDEAAGSCEPHGDHWHCPSGVPKPTTPPQGGSHKDHAHDDDHDHDAQSSCVPHKDHWHCPSGVAKPTTPPPLGTSSVTASRTSGATPTSSAPSGSSSTAASGNGGGRNVAPFGTAFAVATLIGALFVGVAAA